VKKLIWICSLFVTNTYYQIQTHTWSIVILKTLLDD